ncbi:hypothetical protein N2152v2_002977 [Parachlorella kessleri]
MATASDWQQWPPPEAPWQLAAQPDHSMQRGNSAGGPDELWCVVAGRARPQPAAGQAQQGLQEAQQAADCSHHLQQQHLQPGQQQQQALPGLPRLRSIRTVPEGGTHLHRRQVLANRAEELLNQGWYYGRAGAGGLLEEPGSSVRERVRRWWWGCRPPGGAS